MSNDAAGPWLGFRASEIRKRFEQQNPASRLALKPFFAAEMARVSAGWASDGGGLSQDMRGFHAGWERSSSHRAQTRSKGLTVVKDMVGFYILFNATTIVNAIS